MEYATQQNVFQNVIHSYSFHPSYKEFVKKALTDLFAALIETSRKTGKEARVNMKGFGTIYLFRNRELAFNAEDESIANLEPLGGQKGTDLFLAR